MSDLDEIRTYLPKTNLEIGTCVLTSEWCGGGDSRRDGDLDESAFATERSSLRLERVAEISEGCLASKRLRLDGSGGVGGAL